MNYQLPIIQEIKAIKNKQEIANIIKAQRISEKVLLESVTTLKPGMKESAVAKFIVARMKYYKVKALAFEPIVAFGKNTANIHHQPGVSRLKSGDLVMFDFGATINGYCSDMTRTYIFGRPTTKQKKVYEAVLRAQKMVELGLIKGLRRAEELDSLARKLINRKFGPASFGHGLGHGIGMVIHEWPSLRPGSQDVLKSGMIVTLEPGVYLPGWGGVRIEDMIVIEKRGIRVLTKVSKKLEDIILSS